jgi:4-hydroxybenzoate polyprenyltransferase
MGSSSLLYRLYTYQKERFPLQVLIFTTLAVVLSSLAVISISSPAISNYTLEIILSFAAGLIFMFNVRVLDEIKDLHFDNEHHKDRPIQRGIISVKTLTIINIFAVIILITISIFSSLYAFFFLIIALIYSFIAGKDFFFGERIRKRFFLYNFLCLMQLFFFQIHLYALMTPKINFLDALLYIHFFFVILNAGILEIGRKLKIKSNEGTGKDTYSSRMGKRSSSFLFLIISIIAFAVFLWLISGMTQNPWLAISGFISLLMVMFSLVIYLLYENNFSEKLIMITGTIYYLSLHLLIAATLFL